MTSSPQTRRRRALKWALLAVLVLTVAVSAAPLQRSGPPDVGLGTKIYAIEMERPARELWPTVGPGTPFEVQAIRGQWLLLDSSAIQRGPVWVNFDQVISFRHKP